MVGDAASGDFGSDDLGSGSLSVGEVVSGDVFSGAALVVGAATVRCVETPEPTGPLSDRVARSLLSARGLTIPDNPAQSTARTPTATMDTTPVTNGRRGRKGPRGASPPSRSLDLAWAQIRPIAPRRMGSSKNCQERAATATVATTCITSRPRLAFCCKPGAVSTIIG